MTASIPGQGRVLASGLPLVEDKTAERPGILRLPLCRQVGGISPALTSRRLFLDTGSNVDRLIGSGLLNIAEAVGGCCSWQLLVTTGVGVVAAGQDEGRRLHAAAAAMA